MQLALGGHFSRVASIFDSGGYNRESFRRTEAACPALGARRERAMVSSRYRRIVVKVGTNLLTAGGDSLHAPTIRRIIGQVAALHRMGIQVVLVSSGAIAAGREALGLMARRPNGGLRRKDIPFKQVMAALGQSRLMQRYADGFTEHGLQVAQALITRGDLDNREGYLNVRNTLEGLLALGAVPIVNENDVVDVREIGEIVFGDNDTLSAAVANVVDAGLLVILTDTDGLYESDPRRDPDAKLIHRVDEIDERIEALAGAPGSARGRGGMATKIEAARAATSIGIPVLVAGGHVPRILERVVAGEEIGTLFARQDDRVHSKERWLLSGLGSRGQITVDEGAVTALRASRCSLLPAGVADVSGDFGRGDVVDICDPDGDRIGSGLTQYSAEEIERIKGAKTGDIVKLLGYRYIDEVVLPGDMALLNRRGNG